MKASDVTEGILRSFEGIERRNRKDLKQTAAPPLLDCCDASQLSECREEPASPVE
jgi:hypothetical protein